MSSVGRKSSKESSDGSRPSSAPSAPQGLVRPGDKGSQNWHEKSLLATWKATYPPKPGASQSSLQPYQNSLGTVNLPGRSSGPTVPNSIFGLNPGFENHVRRAIRQHKVFSVHPHFPAIRRALINRGWIEKVRGFNVTISNANRSSVAEIAKRAENESEDAWLLRGLRDYPADFVWVFLGDYVNWSSLLPSQVVSWHPVSPFTSKVGICACLQQSHWVGEVGTATVNFPRCYRLGVEEERTAFTSDFRLTACLGLLKWVIGAYERDGERGVVDPTSHVLPVCVDFAVRQVSHYARVRKHEDVDWVSPPSVTAYQWDVFLNQYYSVVVNKGKLALGEPENTARHMYDSSLKALQRVAPFWPQLLADGTNNVWICKPAARNRGIGIVLMNNLEKILNNLMTQNYIRDSNWVVQKYIERPMLIYRTKFDIRQWFIVTDWSPLTVWFYKESYLRFCSKQFSLEDLDESIHLCNNAVQVKYKNADNRDGALPEENMWDNYTFIAYLRTIGKMDLWDKVIYPGMKQAIICVLLASQEEVTVRKNCFELYGADFMLSDNCAPWLIEINNSPCMAPTTSVTARMCNQCLFDLVKVVVDRRANPNANTGLFELIYKQASPTVFSYFPSTDLTIYGRKLGRDVDWPSVVTKCQTKKGIQPEEQGQLLSADQPMSSSNASIESQRLTFQELITRLRFKDAQARTPIEYKASTVAENSVPKSVPAAVSAEDEAPLPSASAASQTRKGKKQGKSKNGGSSKRSVASRESEKQRKESRKSVQFNQDSKQENEKRSNNDQNEQQPKPNSTASDSMLMRSKRKRAHSESPAKKRAKSSDPELSKGAPDKRELTESDVKSSPSKLNTNANRPSAVLAAAKLSLTLDKGIVKPFSSTTYKAQQSVKVSPHSATASKDNDSDPAREAKLISQISRLVAVEHTAAVVPADIKNLNPPSDLPPLSSSAGEESMKANEIVPDLKEPPLVSTPGGATNQTSSVRTSSLSGSQPMPTKARKGTGLSPPGVAVSRFYRARSSAKPAATTAPLPVIAEEAKSSDSTDPDSAATKTLSSGYPKPDKVLNNINVSGSAPQPKNMPLHEPAVSSNGSPHFKNSSNSNYLSPTVVSLSKNQPSLNQDNMSESKPNPATKRSSPKQREPTSNAKPEEKDLKTNKILSK